MSPKARFRVTLFAGCSSLLCARQVAAQAWTPPQGVGAVSLSWQWIENTGHILTDGYRLDDGQSVSHGLFLELEYGITDSLVVSAGVPYVFAKYTGKGPTPAALPIDMNRQWNSALQDFSFSVRRRLIADPVTLTPGFAYLQPSHAYPYQGEAVPGRRLREAQLSLNLGREIAVLPGAYVQGRYSYAFVERVLDVPNNRSNLSLEVGAAVGSKLSLRALTTLQHTHGGLRVGSPTGNPFPPFSQEGDISTPELFDEHDRMLRDNYWRLGLGASLRLGLIDLSLLGVRYMDGADTHEGYSLILGATWYFQTRRYTTRSASAP